jgi:hypothetical protein
VQVRGDRFERLERRRDAAADGELVDGAHHGV